MDDPRIRSRGGFSPEFYDCVIRRAEERRPACEGRQARRSQFDIHRPAKKPPSQRAMQLVATLPPRSRKPGGRHRAGQRAPGRCPPKPTIPVIPDVVLGVLRREWLTPDGTPNVYRVRALAVIAVAMAAPKGTTTISLCRLLPHEVRRLPIPREGRRWLRRWFRIREHWLDRILDEGTPWLALPPMSRGMPRMICWAMTQTLHRAKAPAWRARELLRAGQR